MSEELLAVSSSSLAAAAVASVLSRLLKKGDLEISIISLQVVLSLSPVTAALQVLNPGFVLS